MVVADDAPRRDEAEHHYEAPRHDLATAARPRCSAAALRICRMPNPLELRRQVGRTLPSVIRIDR